MESKFWCFSWRAVVIFTAVVQDLSIPSLGAAQKAGLPDYSNDYYTEDRISQADDSEFVYDIRDVNEEKPKQCRIDICKPDICISEGKGFFIWPENQIETRIYLRCPYSIFKPVYAFRECTLLPWINSTVNPPGVIFDPTGNETVSYVIWGPPTIYQCPDSPLSQLVELLEEHSSNNIPTTAWYIESIMKINLAVKLYPEAPLLCDDISFVPPFLSDAVDSVVTQGVAFDYGTTRNALEIIDILLIINNGNYYSTNLYYCLGQLDDNSQSRFLKTMALLSEMWPSNVTGSEEYFHGYCMTVVAVKPGSHFNVDFLYSYSKIANGAIAISISITDEQVLHVLHNGCTDFLTSEQLYEKMLRFLPLLPSENSTKLPPPPLYVDAYQEIADFEIVSSMVYVSVTRDIEEGLFPPRIISPNGSVLLVDYINYDHLSDPLYVPHLSLDLMTCGQSNPFDNTLEDYTGKRGSLWRTSTNCEGSFRSPDPFEGHYAVEAQCSCSSFGFIAVFAKPLGSHGVLGPPGGVKPPGESTTFSEFLGFAYMYELYIASNVSRAISLACLMLTVLSYIIFRKARHGRPTHILINLCVTLILFLIMLYVAESVAGTRWGCRISNILRYYLVMVSLLWNAAEAVNVYLMIIKVFKTHIHHFVWKAAIIAWGVPLIPIIIILAVTPKEFDGIFLEHNCQFSCQLRPQVFYYGYFIPMGIIILYNSVIFGLLLKVIFKRDPVQHGENKKSVLVRAGGAITMMILLGIPWAFSAFGALDEASENKDISNLSAVFQIIFIVFINLQGTFIFFFHCVRNEDMRNQWRATFFKCKGETTYSSSGSVPIKGTKDVSGALPQYGTPSHKNASSKTQKKTETTFLDSTSSNSKDQAIA